MNDLVAKAKVDVDKDYAGAGPLDGIEDFAANIDHGTDAGRNIDWTQLGIDGAGMALDAAGAIVDPLGTLASSAIGWVIENVGWVREPFDDLMGDPAAIEAVANTWGSISKHLDGVAEQYKASMSQVSDWKGQSGAAYRGHAANLYEHVKNASAGATAAENEIKLAGACVSAVRAFMRDLLAELAGTLMVWGLGALASSVVTAGASVAAFVVRAVAKAIEIAGRMAQLLKKLFAALEKLGSVAKSATTALTKRADDVAADGAGPTRSTGSGGSRLDTFTDSANTKADNARAKADQWSQKASESRQEAERSGRGMDMSALGHDAPSVRAADASEGPLAHTRVGHAAGKIDDLFNKSALDGQGVVRGAFSGDLKGHLTPSAGDLISPAKEFAKEENKAFHQDEQEKVYDQRVREEVGRYLTREDAQPHIVSDDDAQ